MEAKEMIFTILILEMGSRIKTDFADLYGYNLLRKSAKSVFIRDPYLK
jgi:hypothetical protein